MLPSSSPSAVSSSPLILLAIDWTHFLRHGAVEVVQYSVFNCSHCYCCSYNSVISQLSIYHSHQFSPSGNPSVEPLSFCQLTLQLHNSDIFFPSVDPTFAPTCTAVLSLNPSDPSRTVPWVIPSSPIAIPHGHIVSHMCLKHCSTIIKPHIIAVLNPHMVTKCVSFGVFFHWTYSHTYSPSLNKSIEPEPYISTYLLRHWARHHLPRWLQAALLRLLASLFPLLFAISIIIQLQSIEWLIFPSHSNLLSLRFGTHYVAL